MQNRTEEDIKQGKVTKNNYNFYKRLFIYQFCVRTVRTYIGWLVYIGTS